MSAHHIRYGIDLGTTNSAVALVDRGTVTILKNDLQHDTTPSAVHYASRGIRVGQRARNQRFGEHLKNVGGDQEIQNAFIEFKRTMGTDHRYVPSAHRDIAVSSEELSAEVLKELMRFGRLRGGKGAEAAVVTIPAAFKIPQQQATEQAATLAGIEQCHLLQEPVAAVMAFGLEAQPSASAKWLVFDFGGGTFDAALVLAEEGQITVKDTEGDNRLGGKDLDLAVVVRYLWPEIAQQVAVSDLSEVDDENLRQGLRQFAEGALIELSTRDSSFIESESGVRLGNGREIDLDLQVSRDEIHPIVAPYFQRAIDKANLLLQRNGLRGADLDDLVLVGGPTHSPILRNMVADQLRPPNTSVDPMTAVAQGAALHASTVSLHGGIVARSLNQAGDQHLALVVDHETTTINEEEFVTVRLRNRGDADRFGPVEVELRREGWSSEWLALEREGTLFEVLLQNGRANTFTLNARTSRGIPVPTNPSEFTIVQGVKLTGSPLTTNLGVAAWNEDRTRRVFRTLEGAEKARPLPVTGVATLRTTTQLRPGAEDRLRIQILEGGSGADGERVAYCGDEVMTLELRGDEVEQVVPADTPFRLTVQTQDSSAVLVCVRVFFETLDEEHELEIPDTRASSDPPREWVEQEIDEARTHLRDLRGSRSTALPELRRIEGKLRDAAGKFRECADRGDTDGWSVAVERLKEVLKGLYGILDGTAWRRLEEDLDKVWDDLTAEDDAEWATDPQLRDLNTAFEAVRERRDLRLGRELLDRMRSLRYERNKSDINRSFIMWAQAGYGRIDWTDPAQARHAVDAAAQVVLSGGSDDEVHRHAARVWLLWADRPGQELDPRDLPQV